MQPHHAALCITVLIYCVVSGIRAQQTLNFSIDVAQNTTPFPHYWEECVGSGHALLGMRRDWQDHLYQAHTELGFKRVRFHGLFDDDMSALIPAGLSWFNIDTVFDYLLQIGMRPYVELSFMPSMLASGSATIMWYKGNITPPKNYTLWVEFISAFAQHIVDRYGIEEISQWTFEVWNEPNCGFLSPGDQPTYFELFKWTSAALKSVNSQLRVGGPVTCQSAWIPDFINYCTSNNVSFDFIATHEYPTDISPTNRDVLPGVFAKAKEQAGQYPLFYSEFNDGLYSNPAYHDTTYASSFLFHLIPSTQGMVDLLSWWTFTDIFEEQGQNSSPFFGTNGWGLLNIYRIPKPSYRAFQILHQIGTDQLPVATSSPNTTAGVWAVISKDRLDVLIYNFDVPGTAVQNYTISVDIENLPLQVKTAELVKIDDTHSNAPQAWLNMGSPPYPTHDQISQLVAVSALVVESIAPSQSSQNSAQFQIPIDKWGCAALTIRL